MLAITDTAAEAITSLTDQAQLPETGGLRISASDPEQGLQLALAPEPGAEDVVLEGGRVTVFLDPVAAQVLDDMVLDVQAVPSADGGQQELRFAIGPQEGSVDGAGPPA